jgi:hypothetical protein
MMSFKYDWNKDDICQFYSTLYFDVDGQRLIWMTDRPQYEITRLQFDTLLVLEHLHTMESRIHTNEILKKEEMLFMYAPGVEANSPKIQNFLLELNWLHRLLQATLAPKIGDTTACP